MGANLEYALRNYYDRFQRTLSKQACICLLLLYNYRARIEYQHILEIDLHLNITIVSEFLPSFHTSQTYCLSLFDYFEPLLEILQNL